MKTGRPTKRKRTDFGERLTQAREQAGLSQQQLADKLGTTQRAVSWWEREPVALRADQLAAVAEALGVTTDYLLGKQPLKARGSGPVGKAKRLFEAVSKLPRHQQEKVFAILEPFVERQTKP
jgi:transcriptional regulator with XRE-family HTH domain